MTDSDQIMNALQYMDDEINRLYRMVEYKVRISGEDLSDQTIDSVKRSVETIHHNFDYIVSDRYRKVKQ